MRNLSFMILLLGLCHWNLFAAENNCPERVHEAQRDLVTVTARAIAGIATIIDVKWAQIDVVDAQWECRIIAKPNYCLHKRGLLLELIRILTQRVESGHEDLRPQLELAQQKLNELEDFCR